MPRHWDRPGCQALHCGSGSGGGVSVAPAHIKVYQRKQNILTEAGVMHQGDLFPLKHSGSFSIGLLFRHHHFFVCLFPVGDWSTRNELSDTKTM